MPEKKKYKRRTHLEIMKAIPGIQQAFRLTIKASTIASLKEGGGIDEAKCNELMLKLAIKVSEIWELSPAMRQYLIQRWVETKVKDKVEEIPGENTGLPRPLYEDPTKDTDKDLELEILLAEKDGNITELADINKKLEDMGTILITPEKMRSDHIYLDVTFIDYKTLRNAYKAVNRCRQLLGIDVSEVKAGAPESIDNLRALFCARLEERGYSRKEMAELLDFKIYKQDIPSGTYPLLHKYLRVGRQIMNKLNKLEAYIHELTGINPDTL